MQIMSRCKRSAVKHFCLAQYFVFRGDCDFAAFGHRRSGSHGEVDECLLDLTAVALCGGKIFGGFDDEFDLFPKQTFQHFADLEQEVVE